jgi:hypothetical protein
MTQNAVFVEIVNYVRSSEYKVTIFDGVPKVTMVNSQTNRQDDPLAKVMSSISSTRSSQRQAAASIQGHFGQPIKWASLSPDGRLIVAGFEDPSVTAITSATVYRAADHTPIMRVQSEGRIRGSLWSEDSKSLTTLESTERMKKTPWGLLSAISGHPIELHAFYLRCFDIGNRSDIRVNIANDIENGEAELHAQPAIQ